MSFSKDYMELITFWYTFFMAIFTFMLNFYYCKSENKIWKILKDTDILFKEFLKITNEKKKFGTFKNILLIYIVVVININIKSLAINTPIVDQNLGDTFSSTFIVFHLKLTWIKYFFYVNIIMQRLDILLNCNNLSKEDFLVHQRILSHLWKISLKVEKILRCQMVLFMGASMIMALFTGYFLSFHIFSNHFSYKPIILLFVPIIGIVFISMNCQRCINKVRHSNTLYFLNKFCK